MRFVEYDFQISKVIIHYNCNTIQLNTIHHPNDKTVFKHVSQNTFLSNLNSMYGICLYYGAIFYNHKFTTNMNTVKESLIKFGS